MRTNTTGGRWRRLLWAGALVAIVAALVTGAACGDDDDDATPTKAPATSPATAVTSPTAAATPTSQPVTGEITVFAASSLTDAFKEAGTAFQAKNPQAKVTFNFAASSALATQINEGGPADVFASADSAQM